MRLEKENHRLNRADFSMANEIFWITGASSGIGEALTYRLSAEGKRVILSGRSPDSLNLVKQKCTGNASNIQVLPFDLGEIEQFDKIVQKAWSLFGRIDVLVNNAGFSQRAPAMDTHEKIERQIMEVNYFAPVALSKAILPYFHKQDYGHIAVVSSIAGKFGFGLRSSYAASKHALHGYFEALRLENQDWPFYITIVCPGRVKTNISINAVKADGSRHGLMDEGQRKGISADKCARIILSAIKNRRYEVLAGGAELLPVYLKRFCPALFYWLIKKIKS